MLRRSDEADGARSAGWRREGTDLQALREGLWLWGLAFAGLAAARYLLNPLLGPFVAGLPLLAGLFYPKTVAAFLFLYLPIWSMRRRGEFPEDYGATLADWPHALGLAAVALLVVLPLYVAGYVLFLRLLPSLPMPLSHALVPYGSTRIVMVPHWPPRFLLHVLDQLFVVALPEEFFYRGYLQTRFKLALGEGGRRLGVPMGRAFFLTQILFAVGHLVEPHPWRLAVFFPALLFGWLRERSGGLVAPVAAHAASNLTVLTLEAWFFGMG
jgi:membrane protease YdiL (CAAX protease family)